MVPFDRVFAELACQEVGVIYAHQDPRLPDGTYVYREFFCSEPDCDCRRVELPVWRLGTHQPLAHLSLEIPSPQGLLLKERPAVTLDSKQPQSELADTLLLLFECMLEWDPGYCDQLAQHHTLWRQLVDDPTHPRYAAFREALQESSVGSPVRPIFWAQ